jgi:hypothetical protein
MYNEKGEEIVIRYVKLEHVLQETEVEIIILRLFILRCVLHILTFVCLRATTLSYDVAHRTVRS